MDITYPYHCLPPFQCLLDSYGSGSAIYMVYGLGILVSPLFLFFSYLSMSDTLLFCQLYGHLRVYVRVSFYIYLLQAVVRADGVVWHLLNVLVSGRGLLLAAAIIPNVPRAEIPLPQRCPVPRPTIPTPFRDLRSAIAPRCGFVRNFHLCGQLLNHDFPYFLVSGHGCLEWGPRKLVWKQPDFQH